MASSRTSPIRAPSACDSCAIRRVRCDAANPCQECQTRSMRCTFFNTRKKRGPKGPRLSTTLKILELQRKGDLATQPECSNKSPGSSSPPAIEFLSISLGGDPEPLHSSQIHCLDPFEVLPMESYFHHLDIFHERLYPIWPVISTQELKQRLTANPADFGSYALAAAICAATITQLGRPSNNELRDQQPLSFQFALIAQCAYQMCHVPSNDKSEPILLPFFMHIYFSNVGKLRSAVDYMHKTVAALQWYQLNQELDNSPTNGVDLGVQQLQIFCLVFIMER